MAKNDDMHLDIALLLTTVQSSHWAYPIKCTEQFVPCAQGAICCFLVMGLGMLHPGCHSWVNHGSRGFEGAESNSAIHFLRFDDF